MRHSHLSVFLLIFLTFVRLIPIFFNETCFADDCLAYKRYIINGWEFPEPLFNIISHILYSKGMDELTIIRLFIFFLPICFTFGLYFLLKDRINATPVWVSLIAVNILPSINLFWFVLIRNGLMLVFVPFFLHYYMEGDYDKSFIFFMLMISSHATFFFFSIPIILLSFKKNKIYSLILLTITLLMIYRYSMPYEPLFSGLKQGMAHLNYLFIDVFFLFISVIGIYKIKKHIFKDIFLITTIMSLIFFFTLVEGWRIIILLNIPIILIMALFMDKYWNRIKYLINLYMIISGIYYFVYLITL